MLSTNEAQPSESTTNFNLCDDEWFVVDKSADNAGPLSICFLPQYSKPKKDFISERDQNHDTKKEQALSVTFLQYDWFLSQNGRS